MADRRWIAETLFEPQGLRMSYAVERVLHEERTAYQHLVLFEHAFFGKMLMLDGATQVTGKDEFVYHEMMSHLPILAHGKAREILIVGGGDCGIAEEVLKHGSVKRLTQVEIDAAVVAFSKRHFPEFTKPVFKDQRFDLVIGDGMDFVANTDRRFDVIIVDSTDPQGPSAVLFSKAFYAACKRCLNKGGVLVTQLGVPMLQPRELTVAVGRLRKVFAEATCTVAAIPTYIGGHMTMGFATDNKALRRTTENVIAARYKKGGGFKTKYWTPAVHRAAFALPRFIEDLVAKAKA